MPGKNEIKKLAGNRTKLVDRLISSLEKKVAKNQEKLLKIIVEEFLDKLDRDGDIIKNTMRNKRLVAQLDNLFKRFNGTGNLEAVKAVADGVGKLVDFNAQYFATFDKPAKLDPIKSQVTTSLSSWLGIGQRGALEENGYLGTVITDPRIKNAVKDMMLGGIVGQKGFFEMKKDLGDYIEGNKNKTGALQQYYRNFVYDTFSVADRTASKIYADKLKLKYAIYEGGLIKTSRKFCRERNGKVFTTKEIEKFNPPTAKQEGYNPFTDLGGYGCRHHLNYIPEIVAFALRPELKNAA